MPFPEEMKHRDKLSLTIFIRSDDDIAKFVSKFFMKKVSLDSDSVLFLLWSSPAIRLTTSFVFPVLTFDCWDWCYL